MTSTEASPAASADDVRDEISRRRHELVELRRHLHRHPEISWEEHETAALVAEHLRQAGLEVREGVGKTGVVGVLRGGASGRTLMIRADIDALPVQERNEVEYASRVPGKMHACGHDGHTAIGIVLAEVLADRRDSWRGNITFAFQPAEELASGAVPMVEDGALRDPHVDAVIGLHLWSPLHVGEVIVQPGPIFASADMFTMRVRGRGGHGAMPHLNVDPILAAAHIITAAQSLVSRELSPLAPGVVTFGAIHGGTAGNVIADEVEVLGTVRAYTPEDRQHLLTRLGELAQGVAAGLRASAELAMTAGTPPCVSDPDMAALVRRAAVASVGEDHIFAGDGRQPVGDDMAVFLDAVPGCYFLVGAGNPERGISAPHHSNRFDIDEDALPIGAEILARAALEYLSQP